MPYIGLSSALSKAVYSVNGGKTWKARIFRGSLPADLKDKNTKHLDLGSFPTELLAAHAVDV